MKRILVKCPLQGALLPLATCITCSFHRYVLDCPHHKSAMPQDYCELCIRQATPIPCPYSNARLRGLGTAGPLLIAGACGFPQLLRHVEFAAAPEAILAPALPATKE